MTTNDFQSVYAFQITLTSHGQSMTTYFDKKGRVQKVEAGIDSADSDHTFPLASIIDHTLLKPDATAEQVAILCEQALQYHFGAVCVFASTVTGLLTAKPRWQAQASKLEQRSVSPWERCPQVPKFMRPNAR